MKTGPIIILEDDLEDQEFMTEVFRSLGVKNELKYFPEGQAVLDYLNITTDKPFMIISDINLPGMDGLELRERIEKTPFLKKKAIPYIFLSTSGEKEAVTKAYDLAAQGFFMKQNTMAQLTKVLKHILDYWAYARHPHD